MKFRRRVPLSRRERLRNLLWPRRGWRRAATYVSRRIMRLRASPHAVAAGVAAGAFSSFTPFIGFHILLGFAVAFLLRGSMLAAALGTAIGNPLTFPLIWISTFEVGRFILAGGVTAATAGPVSPSADLFSHGLFEAGITQLWPTLKPMIVGAVPLGAITAIILYFLCYQMVATHQTKRNSRNAQMKTLPPTQSSAARLEDAA
ncbi:DUF2062 domain-containing protein [Methylobrevis pamukkalensis]|uniref:DUF2062 domain-containing protein n=1 Tax=Methylobrevis pamukkalensis TaxID=1439726 RepID=A0A1E3H3R2_9HYPH|nr:DUF2062 domain-containing protein [Methylobrevis pamukkalensis]ODN70426.1 hypothetical protein A6302_02229 [Methylobrevis pamukkalensis]